MNKSVSQCLRLRQILRTRLSYANTSFCTRAQSLSYTSSSTPVRPISIKTSRGVVSQNTNAIAVRNSNLLSLRDNGSTNRKLSTQQSESPITGTIGSGAAGTPSSTSADIPASLQAPEHLDEAEAKIFNLLNTALEPTELQVQDISGGCGSMYGIDIVSEKFRGKGMLQQQRMVNGVLGEMIKGWHGVQLKCRVP